MNLCWFCGTEAVIPGKITRGATCAKCRMALKCCKNCRHFDPSSHNQCREPAAEWVRDKELSNFCEFFDMMETAERPRGVQADDARKRFDSIFKK